jgi:hypothetical protein
LIASPPIKVWIPNHPQATIALRMAGMFAPYIPNDDLAKTGKGIPYLVPGCALNSIGTSTIRLPTKIVIIDYHQFIPTAISPPAIIYVGMQ